MRHRSHEVRRRIWFTVPLALFAVFLCVSGSVAFLYYVGVLQFNYPDRKEFAIRGLDVSHHQGKIDWKTVSKEGLSFVFIKATQGKGFKDPRFRQNWRGARKAGLVRGAYHYFSFCVPGRVQARNFNRTVPREAGTLPPVVDFEIAFGEKPECEPKLEEVEAFLERVHAWYGNKPIIYTEYRGYEYLRGRVDNYHLWFRDVLFRPKLPDDRSWLFWQYHDRGRLDGIEGDVDLNVFNGSRRDFEGLLTRKR